MSKVGIFIDGGNMFYAQRNNQWHIDWKKVYDYCAEEGEIVTAYYYSASPYFKHVKQIEKHRAYKYAISNIGYTFIDKPLKIIKSKKKKGNLDIEMSNNMLMSMNLFDICYLFSGDGDYVSTVNHLRNCGKRVICVARKFTTSIDLKNCVNTFINLNDIRDKIEKI